MSPRRLPRPIGRIVEAGKPVVLTSRCYESLVMEDNYAFVGSEKYLRRDRRHSRSGLNGPKARIKLILALSQTRDVQLIREIFNCPIEYRA